MADPSYPDDLLYHPEHDWARVSGEEATFGITWYAQDSLGEVVFFDPPAVGSTVSKVLWVLRMPYRALKGFFSRTLVRPEAPTAPADSM